MNYILTYEIINLIMFIIIKNFYKIKTIIIINFLLNFIIVFLQQVNLFYILKNLNLFQKSNQKFTKCYMTLYYNNDDNHDNLPF